MGAVIVKKAGALAPAMPNVKSAKMVAVIAGELPPTLREGQSIKAWLQDTSEFIGQHPEPVLVDACEAIRSTQRFMPSKAEIIQNVLDAYQRLGVALSDDAKRHLSYRRKMPARYTLNDHGEKRFADDAKVTLIGYFTLQGPQANIIIDAMPGATVEDVEKAIAPVAKAMKSLSDRVTADDVLDRFRHEVAVQIAYRVHGDPAAQCGGAAAEVFGRSKSFLLASPWFALSQGFVDRMRDRYPYARCRDDVHSWGEAMRAAFIAVAGGEIDIERYGIGLQHDAEAAVEARMADMNRTGRTELLSWRRYEARGLATAMHAIDVAEQRLAEGVTTAAAVTIDGENLVIDSAEKCAAAWRKAQAFKVRLDKQIAALAGAGT